MTVRVIVPPEPFLTPNEVPGQSADDERVKALIEVAVEEIDGPTGWLGRCLGAQTLELVADTWGDRSFRLPCPPIIEKLSVTYLDGNGAEQTVATEDFSLTGNLLWFRPNWSAPALGRVPEPIRIRYRAGYSGSFDNGGTGPVPARVKHAVIIAVQDLMRTDGDRLGIRSETVEGVGVFSYLDTDRVSQIVTATAERLLSGLRVMAL